MAATITANPKTLTVPTWGIPRTTTVTWNTGDATIKGSVFLTIIDTHTNTIEVTDQLFDDGAQNLQPPRPIGTNPVGVRNSKWNQQIDAGKQYIFRLKRVDTLAVMAEVIVDGLEKFGLPGIFVSELLHRIPFTQGIMNLRVIPGVDTVRFKFRTRQPTKPLITISNAITGNAVAINPGIFGNPAQVHDFEFKPRIGMAFPLEQEMDFNFHIIAPAMKNWGVGKDAEESGLFRSGFRNVQVFFDVIHMYDDGDPGWWLGDGDFFINCGAGDLLTRETLAVAPEYGRAEIASGEITGLNRSVSINHAPIGLWVQIKAIEDDGGWFHFRGNEGEIAFASEGSDWHLNDDFEVSTVTKFFDLSDAGESPQVIPFLLETTPKHVNFTVDCHLIMEAHNGVVLAANVSKRRIPRMPIQISTILFDVGQRAVLGQGVHARQIQLAAGGRVYATPSNDKKSSRHLPWTRLANGVSGPLTAVVSADALHLLTVDSEGQVLHKALPPHDSSDRHADEPWQSLGGNAVSPVVAAAVQERIDLFVLDKEGRVLHRPLTVPPTGEWQAVGKGITGSLNTFASPKDGLVVLGVGPRGEVLYQHWSPGKTQPDSPTWKSLGLAPSGELSADFIDDSLVLAVIAEDETVSFTLWQDFPEVPSALAWRVIGTVTSLMNDRLSLHPETHKADLERSDNPPCHA